MQYIVLVAVIGILVLHMSGAIPLDSVGGSLVIAMAFFVAALAIAIYEAWEKKRGVVGWIVNIVVAFVGAFLAAQLGGAIVAILVLSVVGGGTSLAAAGGPAMGVALALMMGVTLLGSWGALWVVNRWRA
jgi:hypothetical protein